MQLSSPKGELPGHPTHVHTQYFYCHDMSLLTSLNKAGPCAVLQGTKALLCPPLLFVEKCFSLLDIP